MLTSGVRLDKQCPHLRGSKFTGSTVHCKSIHQNGTAVCSLEGNTVEPPIVGLNRKLITSLHWPLFQPPNVNFP